MGEKKKCKHLCVDCKHYHCTYYIGYKEEKCSAWKTKDTSCVSGETITIDAICSKHNENGCCSKWETLPHAELRRVLEEYIHGDKDAKLDCFGRDSVERELASDLLRRINDEESKYLEGEKSGDTPYDYEVIVTKKAIEKSLRIRGYNLDYREKGELYSDCEKIDKETLLKERAWLARMKRALSWNDGNDPGVDY